jgi:hypothetical protein
LLKYNGLQGDTFPAFNTLSASNKVYALAVDAGNTLWIGSNMGLTKYNGISFTTYNTGNTNLVSDTIISLACVGSNVYAGTRKGLAVFNGTSFTNYNHAANGMKSDTVNCITTESGSAIWLGNNYGLEKFNGSTFAFNYVAPANAADTVNCIYIDAQNTKWLGTNNHGVIKYDNANFYTMQQLYPPQQDMVGYGKWPTVVKSICKGSNGGVFFGALTTIFRELVGYSTQGAFEITSTKLYYYVTGNSNYYISFYSCILQHDVGSNKVFCALQGYTNPYGQSLSSFDATKYEDILDVSSTNSDFLDINNVNALITANSSMHWDNTSDQSKYFTPKQNNTSPLHSSAMWIGGYNQGNLRVAAMTYRQNGYDFWPGPVDTTNTTTDTATVMAYNKVWKVNRYDIANFIYNWNAGKVQNGTFVPVWNIISWPAQGTGNYTRNMAPFVDVNHNGIYDPIHDGDYPLIKGDQMIWTVFNDVFNKHGETGSDANLGIEVHVSVYAFVCPDIADSNAVLNNTTFYNYQVLTAAQIQ